MPATDRAMAAAVATSASMSRPAAGRIWIVTSRPTLPCHSLAAPRTSITAPVVSAAKNDMMAIAATRARAEMVARGTIGVWNRGGAGVCAGTEPSRSCTCRSLASVIDMQAALVQHQPAGVDLIHQCDIVGGNHHRSAGPVQLDEQAQ